MIIYRSPCFLNRTYSKFVAASAADVTVDDAKVSRYFLRILVAHTCGTIELFKTRFAVCYFIQLSIALLRSSPGTLPYTFVFKVRCMDVAHPYEQKGVIS